MKENNWEECIEFGKARKCTPDNKKAESLIKIASSRKKYLDLQEINELNANFIFEGYYSCITELLHAFVLRQGFNISNHLCLGFYLRDFIKKINLYLKYDDLRYKRNSLLYYGVEMEYPVAFAAIQTSKKLMHGLLEILENQHISHN